MQIDSWLTRQRTRLSEYVDTKYITALKADYLRDRSFEPKEDIKHFIQFLFSDVEQHLTQAQSLTHMLQELRQHLAHTVTRHERETIILEYAYRFNPSKVALEQDRRAFKRWFDEDALAERILSKRATLYRRSIVALERIESSIILLTTTHSPTPLLWREFDFNSQFLTLFGYQPEPQLLQKIFSLLLTVIKQFHIDNSMEHFDESIIQSIYRFALSSKHSVWIQNNALEFLAYTEFHSFWDIAILLTQSVDNDDTIFVRHKIATLALTLVSQHPRLAELIETHITQDPSPYVRHAIAKQLATLTHPTLLHLIRDLILYDSDESVQAQAMLQALQSPTLERTCHIWEILLELLSCEASVFVHKSALYTLSKLAFQSLDTPTPKTHQLIKQSRAVIKTHLASPHWTPQLKRYASAVRERLWVTLEPARTTLYTQLQQLVANTPPHHATRLPHQLQTHNREILYRTLSVVAQQEFSLELRTTLFNHLTLQRGERMGRRAWRVLFELRHPSPDKREAFPHTIARIFEGTHHFPSTIMAEQAPTKVPGEPYFIPEEETPRPFLPLLDHYLSSLTQPTLKRYPFILYAPEGVTTITPPPSWWQRIKAQWHLTLHYATIAPLRNWQHSSASKPNTYTQTLAKLGFTTTFRPYVQGDSSSSKFFSLALPLPFLSPEMRNILENYFVSAYENSLSDLTLFLVVIFALFMGRHIRLSRQIKRARASIPLSIGGWGTRGKSGTERIKAALFNSLGLRVFSKTTGNEAMFLHSESFEEMREMYLFRPYDKATIWEQADTVLLASKLDIDVYLWESMGLTPSYVNILQQRWMHDDIATITNTYPDHENLQGPAGINIPQVMTNFIPPNSTMVTSEEVMYPILDAYAKQVNTKRIPTGWLQAGLIPPDILSRFPYEEHPFNIALVLGVAHELDIDEDEALKAMADYIVPDLGVLKDYPPATVEGKQLRFINGMSANERFGALGNWRRMKLDKIDRVAHPNHYLTTVINNRADRVSRSRVFASMIVEDVVADCHILIGSNLSGFLSYLEESWESYKAKLSLTDDPTQTPKAKLMVYAKQFRLIHTPSQLQAYLRVMLTPLALEKPLKEELIEGYEDLARLQPHLEEQAGVWAFYCEAHQQYQAFIRLKASAEDYSEGEALDSAFREALWGWLKARIKPLHHYHASGNEVVQFISDQTPSGMLNTIIGMQNIKGTGLDFAYRWVAWNSCYLACHDIMSEEKERVRSGVDRLAAFEEHGPLTFALTQEAIAVATHAIATQSEYYQAQLQQISHNLKEAQAQTLTYGTTQEEQEQTRWSRYKRKFLEIVESFLDAGDAVKRRKRANKIYADLVTYHISHKRAAVELQAITKRQKGGWFTQRFS